MRKIKHSNKIQNFIKKIITDANDDKISLLFHTLKEFQQLAIKIPEQDQEDYEAYFTKHFDHELRLLKIEQRKIEMNYKDAIFRTDKQSIKFEERLSDKSLSNDMREFYHKEYLNILKPQFILEQVLENFRKYLEVLNILKDEFNEWFFLGRIDYIEQLLQSYIARDPKSKRKDIWIYKRYEKELTTERKQKMYQRAGLKLKS